MSEIDLTTSFSWQMLYAFFLVFFSGILILNKTLRFKYVIAVSFIKSLIPLIYVTLFFDPVWSPSDTSDVVKFFNAAYNLKGEIRHNFEANGYLGVLDMLNTWTFITYFWFLTSLYIFGEVYWAPLFFSVIFSFLSMRVLYFLLVINDFKKNYSKSFVIFYGLHPYVIAWTSFVPLRESLVAFLLLCLFYMVFGILNNKIRLSFFSLGFLSLILFVVYDVRYNLTYIALVSLVLYLILYGRGINFIGMRTSYFKSALGVLLIIFLMMGIVLSLPSDVLEHVKFSSKIPFYAVKWFLGPITLSPEYTFLYLGVFFHIVLFLPSLIAGYSLWKQSFLFKFLIVNLLCASLVYGAAGFGIRHRFQFEFILILMQFHLFYMLFKNGKKYRIFKR